MSNRSPDGEGVEFIVDPDADDGWDGDPSSDAGGLPDGRPRTRRGPVAAGVLVVVALAIAVIAHGRADTTRPAAARSTAVAPSTSFTPAPMATVPGVRTPQSDGLIFNVDLGPPASCAHRCTSSPELPKAFTSAVAKQFPHLRTVSTRTLRRAGKIAYREYLGTSGVVQVQVAVLRGELDVPFTIDAGDDGQRTVVIVEHVAHGFTSIVKVVTPSGRQSSFGAVRKLAIDPRLLPTG